MSLVRVSWTETHEYEATVEVPGFDLEHGTPDDLREAVNGIAPWERSKALQDEVDVDITGHEIIREGEE